MQLRGGGSQTQTSSWRWFSSVKPSANGWGVARVVVEHTHKREGSLCPTGRTADAVPFVDWGVLFGIRLTQTKISLVAS